MGGGGEVFFLPPQTLKSTAPKERNFFDFWKMAVGGEITEGKNDTK